MKTDPLHDEMPTAHARPGLVHAVKRWFKGVSVGDKHDLEEEVFVHLMETARETVVRLPSGIASLVAAILRPLQAEHMLSVAERPQHAAHAAIGLDQLFSSDDFFRTTTNMIASGFPPTDTGSTCRAISSCQRPGAGTVLPAH